MNSEQKEVTNMQTDNRIVEEMLSDENLNKAYLQVVKNKGAEGVNGMKYTELNDYLKEHGEEIKEQIRTRKYKPKPVIRVEVPKIDGGVSSLGVPTVLDRFIQQAITQVLTPITQLVTNDLEPKVSTKLKDKTRYIDSNCSMTKILVDKTHN